MCHANDLLRFLRSLYHIRCPILRTSAQDFVLGCVKPISTNNNLEELRFNWPAGKKVQDVSALSAIIMPTSLLFKQDGTTLMLFECVWDSDAGFAVQIYPDWEMGRQDLFL